MSKQVKNDLETVVIKGQITATSNAVGKFKTSPRKTAYITVLGSEDAKKLIDLGLTEYTSKEDGNKFFIIKLSNSITIWIDDYYEEIDTTVNSKNFQTVDNEEIDIAILKGESVEFGNNYTRIYALKLKKKEDIIFKEKENPFV